MKTTSFLSLRSIVLMLALILSVGSANAQQTFQITTLSTTGASLIEHEPITGDDRGGIALSASQLFYTGDGSTGRFDITNLSNAASVGVQYNALVSNIRTKQVYSLGTSTGLLPNGGGVVTRLIPLDPSTGLQVAGDITLSASITLGNSGNLAGIFAGWDRIVLLDGTTLNAYNIDLPSGTVTSLGVQNLPSSYFVLGNRMSCENWATWGIAEYFGTTIRLVYPSGDGEGLTAIQRFEIGTGTVSTVVDFPSGTSDMCSITADPSANRWYFHYEGYAGAFDFGVDEVIGYADATFLGPSAADVQIAGRVRTPQGRGVSGVSVKAFGLDGNFVTVLTNTFGYYTLPKLKAGDTYVVTAESRRYVFAVSRQVVTTNDNLAGVDFETR
ncbi:MAG: carboxypeptidase-like regulatory domain-containing protein [Pyrinomonadaceae bacterium]